MSEKEDPQRVVKREFKRACPVDLSDAEIKKLGQKAGKLSKKMNLEEVALKERHKEERAGLKKQHAGLLSMLASLESGTEDREIKCVEIYDYRNDVVEVVRTDTEEVVEKRRMEPGEHQEDLPSGKKKAGKRDKADDDNLDN